MIKAYLAGIESPYEGEDIEIQYCIYEDMELLCKKSVLVDYVKPAIVGQVALRTLLKKLKNYMDKEIVVIVNDTVLYESIRGTLKTKNKDVLKMAKETRKKIDKFQNIIIQNVSGNHASLFQVSPKDITLIGDSAGGNLAAALSLMARDKGEFIPTRQILLYPSTFNDHSDNSPFDSIRKNGTGFLLTSKRVCDYMELYLGGTDNRNNPYFAPLLAENLKNQPKTLIITADYDPLRDEGEAYGMALKKAGNDVHIHRMTDALHGFFALPPTFSPVKKSYRLMNSFLKKPF